MEAYLHALSPHELLGQYGGLYIPPIMENQMEKRMQNEMGIYIYIYICVQRLI